MKRALVLLALGASAFSWTPATRSLAMRTRARLSMSTIEKKEKTRELLDGINKMKIASDYLRQPLREDMADSNIYVSKDAYNLLKFHGSYQQDDREKRPKGPKSKGQEKAYQFMLRLKVPGGEVPGPIFKKLDELCMEYGQGDLRITTRQAFQLHGVMKNTLGTVIKTIMEAGSTTIGGCGDINRNTMTTPAPIDSPEYAAVREWTGIMAELFVPQTNAFSEIWLDGEKVASTMYWKRHIKDMNNCEGDGAKVDEMIQEEMYKDTGRGIVTGDPVEPLYGNMYLPRKFKIGVTVPGDNSLDIYTNDIGLVVMMNEENTECIGFNVMVGGGMGRTHGKETTFARTADHLGFVPKEKMMETAKAIVAAQRDFGNREIRANARLKYLVHEVSEITRRARAIAAALGRTRPPYPNDPNLSPRARSSASTASASSSSRTSSSRSTRGNRWCRGASRTGWAGTTRRTARSSSASTSSRAACSTSPTARSSRRS